MGFFVAMACSISVSQGLLALLCVLVSLAVGSAYRTWVGPEGPTFTERLRAMEEGSALDAERGLGAGELAGNPADPGSGAGDGGSRRAGAADSFAVPAPVVNRTSMGFSSLEWRGSQ